MPTRTNLTRQGGWSSTEKMKFLWSLESPIKTGSFVPTERHVVKITQIAILEPCEWVRLAASAYVLKPIVLKYPQLAESALDAIGLLLESNQIGNETIINCLDTADLIGAFCPSAVVQAIKVVCSVARPSDQGKNVAFPKINSDAHVQGVLQGSLSTIIWANRHTINESEIAHSGAFETAKIGLSSRHAYVREHALGVLNAIGITTRKFADEILSLAKMEKEKGASDIGCYVRSYSILAALAKQHPRLTWHAFEAMQPVPLEEWYSFTDDMRKAFLKTQAYAYSLHCDLANPTRSLQRGPQISQKLGI